jgi:hypothetical protein
LVDKFGPNLLFLAVEKCVFYYYCSLLLFPPFAFLPSLSLYFSSLCTDTPATAAFGGPDAIATDPQSIFPLYLTHDAHTELLAPYLNATAYTHCVGKPFLMFETNTVCASYFPPCARVSWIRLLSVPSLRVFTSFTSSLFHHIMAHN